MSRRTIPLEVSAVINTAMVEWYVMIQIRKLLIEHEDPGKDVFTPSTCTSTL